MKTIKGMLFKIYKVISKPVYKLYEKILWMQIKDGPFPVHIGIIPDGNRRWARRLGMDPMFGHKIGYERIKDVINWILELNVKAITIYAMSSENCLYRPEEERKHLFELARKGLQELMNMRAIHENKVRVRVFGKLDLVPKDIVDLAKKLEQITKDYDKHVLNIALCYGGRDEIINAVRRIGRDIKEGKLEPDDINEEIFSHYLYTDGIPDPDLIIRTSGEVRISNFLLWQSAYSELYFCDVFWPEFRKIDFWRAIRNYQHRERRFGR